MKKISKYINITIKYLSSSKRFSKIELLKFKIITLINNTPAKIFYQFYLMYSKPIKNLNLISVFLFLILLVYFTKISFDHDGFKALISSLATQSFALVSFNIDYNFIIISFKNTIVDFVNKYLYNIHDYSIDVSDTNIEDSCSPAPAPAPIPAPAPSLCLSPSYAGVAGAGSPSYAGGVAGSPSYAGGSEGVAVAGSEGGVGDGGGGGAGLGAGELIKIIYIYQGI